MARITDFFKRVLSNTIPRTRPFEEQGSSGIQISGGYVRTGERNTDWIGARKYRTAADIVANVSIVAAATHYFLNVCARPKWKVVPSSDSDPEAVELADFVDSVIYSMQTPWEKVIRKSATYRFYGFALHEWRAERRPDGRIGYAQMEVRPQHTIERWEVEDSGSILGVYQRSPQTNQILGIPRGKLFYLVEDTLTDSPEGMGMFRHMAEPYNRLKRFLELETRAFERDLRGTPIGRAPLAQMRRAVKAGEMTQADMDRLVAAMNSFIEMQVKQSDTGMLLDSATYESQAADGPKITSALKWNMELLQGSPAGMVELANAIDRLQREMARIIGAEMLMMDVSGSRALSEDKSRNLYLTANSILSNMAAIANQDVIGPLWVLNGFPEDKKPWFVPEDVTFKDAEMIAKVLRDMATAGAMLDLSDPVVDDVRDLLGVTRPNRDGLELESMLNGAGDEEEPTASAAVDELEGEEA